MKMGLMLRNPLSAFTTRALTNQLQHVFSIQSREFGINRNTTFLRLPGMASKEMHANYADPEEREDGSIDLRSWEGKSMPAEKEVPFGEWNPKSKRCGVIGRKMGMMNVWDARGVRIPLCVIRLEENTVIEVRKKISPRLKEQRVNLQVGAGKVDPAKLKKGQLVAFRKAGVEPKEKVVEFPVSLDAILPVGTKITARHFVPGQFVDIIGRSKDKGFQGVMKRWGYAGQPASHGVSLTHRAPGSTGCRQDPGRVWPGKNLPGHMGNNRMTVLNIRLYKIDVDRDLLFLQGTVPGNDGDYIQVKDAVRRPFIVQNPPPFPTFDPSSIKKEDMGVNEIVMDVSHLGDPFAFG